VRVIELGEHMAHAKLTQRFLSNWNIKKTRLSKNFNFEASKNPPSRPCPAAVPVQRIKPLAGFFSG
jgi:hypothetical protein